MELSDRVRSTKCHSRRRGSLLLPYRKPTPSGKPVSLIRPKIAQARRITVRLRIMAKIDAKCSAPRAHAAEFRNCRYTFFLLAGGNFREIGRFVWNLLAFVRRGSVGRCWKVSSLPFFYSVQYSMERKSTKRRLNWP